jgi:7-cyano-7-deazaguanine synthase
MGGKAVVLMSGGLDSTVTAAIAKREGYGLYALTFDYGQRHLREIESARRVTERLGVLQHRIMRIDLTQIGGSALTDGYAVPRGKSIDDIRASKEIPSTYVPARNTILLSMALAYAEVADADAIYIGANHVDYSGYPDCRPEYFEAYQKMANLATKRAVEGRGIEIKYPIIAFEKKDIIRRGIELGAPLELTWSCYSGGEKACGRCDSCVIRLNGFKEAGLDDQIDYESR